MKRDDITIDFETFSELDIAVGAWNYSQHESTEPLILSYKFNDEETKYWDFTQGWDLPKELEDRLKDRSRPYRIIAHNYWFEFSIWTNCCVPKYGWPELPEDCWFDTQYQCGMSAIPFSLFNATRALNLEHEKLDSGKKLIDIFSKLQKDGRRIMPKDRPTDWKNFVIYCVEDTNGTYEIYITLLQLKDQELEFAHLTHKLNIEGIPVDVEAAKSIYPKILKEKEYYVKRMSEITNGTITTIGQTARMKAWILAHDEIELPNFAADTVSNAIAGDFGELSPISLDICEMRRDGGKSSTSKYEILLKTVSSDGRIHGTLLHHGARTGRYAGYGFQPQNLPKPSIDTNTRHHVLFDFDNLSLSELLDKYGIDFANIECEAKDKDTEDWTFNKNHILMEHLIYDLKNYENDFINKKYGSFMKAASTAVRGMVQAPYGKILYGADYAAIEARIVFWVANCLRGLKLYHDKFDVYKDMAAVIYSSIYADIDDDQRWLGKQAILGCGYGLGWKGFINTCFNYGVTIREPLAKKTIDAYRETYSQVPDVWEDLDEKSILAVKSGHQTFAAFGRISFKTLKHRNGMVFMYMKLPSGRLISYPDVKLMKVKTPWGARRTAITYKVNKNNMWVRDSTYGGKLLENACQAIARDIMMHGADNAAKQNINTIFQVHDELIALADIDQLPLEEYEDLLCNPMPDWAKGLPLAAEGKIISRYQKL